MLANADVVDEYTETIVRLHHQRLCIALVHSMAWVVQVVHCATHNYGPPGQRSEGPLAASWVNFCSLSEYSEYNQIKPPCVKVKFLYFCIDYSNYDHSYKKVGIKTRAVSPWPWSLVVLKDKFKVLSLALAL